VRTDMVSGLSRLRPP